MGENERDNLGSGIFGLHNDVNIKIGIIYKNRNFSQKALNFNRFWSIVFMKCEYLRVIMPISLLPSQDLQGAKFCFT